MEFKGLVDNATIARYCGAADLFVLPSLLEALPTVAVEALAAGTPVVSSDNPGGLELNELFGPDVEIVPREQPLPLAAAITGFLDNKRRAQQPHATRSRESSAQREWPRAIASCIRASAGEPREPAARGNRAWFFVAADVPSALLGAMAGGAGLMIAYGLWPALYAASTSRHQRGRSPACIRSSATHQASRSRGRARRLPSGCRASIDGPNGG